MVRVGKKSADVLHEHPKVKGSKTDKVPGAVLHSYSFAKYGKANAIKKAWAQHSAIMYSEALQRKINK